MQQLFLIALILLPAFCKAQMATAQKKTNQLDGAGKQHGTWVYHEPERMGEPGTMETGNYDHGNRTGIWYTVDDGGDLISIESFAFDELDGEVKYYERGQLYCVGHYRALNPKHSVDTIIVVDPITHDESYKTITTDKGTMRHGTWRYYDPENGSLLKEEEYQVDELIFKKQWAVSQKADSLYGRWRNKLLPHRRKGNRSNPPDGREFHYSDVIKRD